MAKLDAIGAWSEEKLELLRRYLVAYTNIMALQKKKWLKNFSYVDAFAGSVTPERKKVKGQDANLLLPGFDDEEDEAAVQYVDGSPLVALKTKPSFDGYYFNDINQARIQEKIAPLMEQYPNKKIYVECGDCNDFLLNKIIPRFPKDSYKRAFVFIDPYGLQVQWETIKALGETETFDIFINFPVHGITRQLRDQPPSPEMRKLINSIMGDDKWYDIVYSSYEMSLLGSPLIVRNKSVAEDLAFMYSSNLKRCFEHVSPPRIMRQQTSSPLYALILASHAGLAVKKMNEIFTRLDKIKGKVKR